MAKATKKPRAPRPKQQFIPGTEPPSIPEIDQAAEAYYEAMKERLPYTAEEKAAKETLINKMVEHRQVRYEFNGFVVNLVDSKNVVVKPKKTEENGDGED